MKDSYVNAVLNIKSCSSLIYTFGGVKLVEESFNNNNACSIFPGIFYKDAVLGVISRSNSQCIISYNQYSYLKSRTFLNVFRLSDSTSVSFEHYLFNKYDLVAELCLSVFFEQSIVPFHEKERLDLIHTLMDFAVKHPERQLVVCTRQYEISPHKPKITFQDIVVKYGLQLPENMQIVEGAAADWLPKAEHVISITSTVLLDAIYNGKQVSILKLKRFKHYEQKIFAESGLLHESIVYPPPEVCPEWKKLHVYDPDFQPEPIEIKGNKEVFDFRLSFKNIYRIFKANYLHFEKLNVDFFKYSLKNIIFFRKYHRIYLESKKVTV
ncbi:MAG: hypothetical protein GY908_10995 [Flavobacteriales bacterium]|nr:hypothetical protein [Flavobacteriales bacterium]